MARKRPSIVISNPSSQHPRKRALSNSSSSGSEKSSSSDLHLGEGQETFDDEFMQGSSKDTLTLPAEAEEQDYDADTPRVAQWEDDEDVDSLNEEEAGPHDLKDLQNNLSEIPLGALRRARNILARVEDIDASGSEESEESDLKRRLGQDEKREKGKVEWSNKPRKDISKRANKHAPTEVTSKRPVTRHRQAVEVHKLQPRDPRFLPTAGEFSSTKFEKNFGFLTEAHQTELKTLGENLIRARKRLMSSPRGMLAERQQEVERLERAMKRTESLVNQDKQQSIAREALGRLRQEEKDKRRAGKGAWWLKESEKREVVMRAKYSALAAEGGKSSVKKAIDKRQKKISQKEKRSRPFPKAGRERERDVKRRRMGDA